MANYEGMRWFKCDLHMQTPADGANWRGVKMGSSVAEMEASAEAYIRRCYEVGLEVIAITDHNFLSKDFIPLLEQAVLKLGQEFGYRITLLPGFEFDADVGKGCHVLAIFEPGTPLEEIDHVLTECGVGFPRVQNGVLAKSTKRLPEILGIVQRLDANGVQKGIAILPHPMENGIFDNDRISEWLQQAEFRNPELLAVEVPKPVSQMNAAWQKLFASGEECREEWRRTRPIACVMSSDSKSLILEECKENYIGRRFSWIKMSKPSVESLRQAFLDPMSRIDLPEDIVKAIRPSKQQTHPRIRGIRVSGLEFLADQEIAFSQNLNTVIGGRGSGKSTLLECLRFALGRENEPSLSEIIKAKIARIAETFTTDTDIQVDWEGVHGQVDTVLLRPRQGRHELTVGEATDFRTYLRHIPVQFFSQQQLSDLTNPKKKNSLLPMIDDACGQDLHALKAREVTLRTEIMQLFAAEDQLVAVRDNITRLKQEITELNRQWQARKDVQQEALAHQRAQAARRYLEQIRSRIAEEVAGIQALAEDIAESHAPLGSEAENWPDAKWFKKLDEQVEKLKQATQIRLLEAAVRYEQDFAAMFEGDAQWPGVDEGLKAAGTRFLEACQERGLQPQDVSRLQEIDRQRQAKQLELTTQEKQEKQLLERVQLLQPRLDDLHGLWRQQHELRLSISNGINEREGKAIKVSVEYMADEASFMATWEQLAPNRSYKIGRNWDDLGKQLFQVFRGQTACLTPWELSLKWVSGEVSANFEELRELFEGHIGANQQKWREVRLTRVADFVDIELRRVEDGTVVGKISDNKLSEGQRNTAVLNLLLAKGEGPIVIDQPEDELDSNFIYQDLVPLLRDMKNRRQLIMATHNANLPVNGDAELIYALEAREGHGRVRTQGGLDRAEVTCAVLDIMEGSAEAFRRRREKYHF